jgi:hypothetical protein
MVKNPSPVRGGAADLRPAGLGREQARAAARRGFTGKTRGKQRASAVDRAVAMRQHTNELAGYGE